QDDAIPTIPNTARTSSSILKLSDFQNSSAGELVQVPETYTLQHTQQEWGYLNSYLFKTKDSDQLIEVYVFPVGGVSEPAQRLCDKKLEPFEEEGKKIYKCTEPGTTCYTVPVTGGGAIIVICGDE
ncbi:MAG: hypothetical protein AAFP00_05325, partial [Bacteroidota bacterium]